MIKLREISMVETYVNYQWTYEHKTIQRNSSNFEPIHFLLGAKRGQVYLMLKCDFLLSSAKMGPSLTLRCKLRFLDLKLKRFFFTVFIFLALIKPVLCLTLASVLEMETHVCYLMANGNLTRLVQSTNQPNESRIDGTAEVHPSEQFFWNDNSMAASA